MDFLNSTKEAYNATDMMKWFCMEKWLTLLFFFVLGANLIVWNLLEQTYERITIWFLFIFVIFLETLFTIYLITKRTLPDGVREKFKWWHIIFTQNLHDLRKEMFWSELRKNNNGINKKNLQICEEYIAIEIDEEKKKWEFPRYIPIGLFTIAILPFYYKFVEKCVVNMTWQEVLSIVILSSGIAFIIWHLLNVIILVMRSREYKLMELFSWLRQGMLLWEDQNSDVNKSINSSDNV